MTTTKESEMTDERYNVSDGSIHCRECGWSRVILTTAEEAYEHHAMTDVHRIDGRLVLDSKAESITVDVPRPSEAFVRVAGVPFES